MTTEFSDKFQLSGCKVVGSTTKGIWVQNDDWDTNQFIPQSMIDADSEIWKEGQSGTLVVNGWLADQRGWR